MQLHQVEVVGVRVEMPSNQPIVLLKEVDGIRYLPIWVGSVEASSIAFAQQGLTPPRPLTHDLIVNLLQSLNTQVASVNITKLADGVFYSEIKLVKGLKRVEENDLNSSEGQGEEISLSARPSDAISLALRLGTDIFVTEELFAAAGIEIPDQADDEVEKFRSFLDQINPEDFLE